MSNFRTVRVSKFRHVYGQTVRREQSYEGIRVSTSAHDSQLCAVNPKFIAVVLEVAGGGAFQVLPLKWTGKIDYHTGRISGHSGVVNDLRWNPFNDNVIASCSDDTKVKLWYIPDVGVKMQSKNCLCELSGHCRRVVYIEWHPTVEGVLASAGADCRVCIWNVTKVECFSVIENHDDLVYSLAFNLKGNIIATTCKDKCLRLFDARTCQLLQDTVCHEGVKTTKVIFLHHKGKLLTTGFNRMSHRQIAIWNQDDISTPLSMHEIDTSPGVLFPFFDSDLNMLYIAGKGDGNIRYYEILHEKPHLGFLSEFQSKFPQRGMGFMSKRGLNVNRCEIFRLYKIHASQQLVEPLSFIVPRKSERFQSDLYPPTAGPTPALTFDEWLCGVDKDPVLIYLEAAFPAVTNKPVQVKMAFDEDGLESRPTLITADRNNERKFQFLAEITKADYRDVTKRDDYGEIMKRRQIYTVRKSLDGSPRKTVADIVQRQTSLVTPARITAKRASLPTTTIVGGAFSEAEEDDEEEEDAEYREDKRLSEIYSLREDTSKHCTGCDLAPQLPATGGVPETVCVTEPSPLSAPVLRSSASQRRRRRSQSSASTTTASSASSASVASPSSSLEGAGSRRHHDKPAVVTSCCVTTVATRLPPQMSFGAFRSPQPTTATVKRSSFTKPGCIAPGPMIHREPTAHIVRPFRVSHSQPPTPRGVTGASSMAAADTVLADGGHGHEHHGHQPPSSKESEIQKLYTQQSKRLRELLAETEPKDCRIDQLERDLTSLTVKVENLQKELHLKQEDIDSLRYEIAWKDKRIGQLEKQLYRDQKQQ